jgi:hypothetical protein
VIRAQEVIVVVTKVIYARAVHTTAAYAQEAATAREMAKALIKQVEARATLIVRATQEKMLKTA